MRLVLMTQGGRLDFLEGALRTVLPGVSLCHWPEDGADQAEVAVCWSPEPGALAAMPHLRLIHSIGAGADRILADPQLPEVPLCRIRDPDLALAMGEYCHWATLWFQRGFDRVTANALRKKWERFSQRSAADTPVAVLGLGDTGGHVARRLVAAGYPVRGWSRGPRSIAGVDCHHGAAGLAEVLDGATVAICLLPLTRETRGILNRDNLGLLAQGAGLVHCGRGGHLVAADLIGLLRQGHLRGAVLDTFDEEPLPTDDPLWSTPGVLVTPHMAALAKPARIAAQIAGNIRCLQAGLPLMNEVNRTTRY